MDEIALDYPFEFEGKTLEKVNFRTRLKGKDLLAVESEMKAQGILSPGDAERTMFIVARAASLPIEAVGEMDLVDYLKMADKASGFF
jgi:hypothetical protein